MRLRERLAGRDATVIAARVISLAVGPVTVVCVGLFLSPVVQGYYYAFGSVLTAALLFEAGISTAIIQIAAHESASLAVTLAGVQGERGVPLERLAGVFRFALRWYWGIAVLLVVVVSSAGWILFSTQDDGIAWQVPWVIVVVLAAVDFAIQPFFVTLEGTGHVKHVYRYRLLRSVVQSTVVIGAVTAGLGLYALALGTGAAVLVGLMRVLPARLLFRDLLAGRRVGAIRWRTDILPFQWRIAVSWAAGYCSVALFTPLLLVTRGATEAGRMGMAVSLVTACTALAASPMVANAPAMGRLAGAADWRALKALFGVKAKQSLALAFVLLMIAVLVIFVAQLLRLPVADRVLPASTVVILSVGFLIYHVEGTFAFFMRAQRKEPYFVLEVVGAVLMVPLALLVSGGMGAFGIVAIFAAVHLVVLLPCAIVILVRSMRSVSAVVSGEPSVQSTDSSRLDAVEPRAVGR